MKNPRLDKFHEWCVRHYGVSARSADRYRREAELFMQNFFKGKESLTKETIERWLISIETYEQGDKTEPTAPSTINAKIAALRAFFAWLVDRGDIGASPIAHVKMRKVPKRLPKPIDKAAVTSLLKAGDDTESDLQGRTMMWVMYGSGLRAEEVVNLRLGHVVDEYSLLVIGKGDKERMVPVLEEEYAALREWCIQKFGDERTALVIEEIDEEAAFRDLRKRFPDQHVFLAANGRAMAALSQPTNAVYKRVKRLSEKVGLEGNHPHRLRHTYATENLEAGADLYFLQQTMGHDDPRTTAVYTEVRPDLIKQQSMKRSRMLRQRENV